MRPGSRIDTLGARVEAHLERKSLLFLALYSLFFLGTVSLFAAARLMWYDEITTEYIARLPSMGDVLRGLRASIDSQPPLLYLFTRAAHAVFGICEWSTRLPQVVGFLVMLWCVFLYTRRLTNALYAAAAMLLIPVTSALEYAYEARPYGILVAFSGLALVFWQGSVRVEGGRRLALLAGLLVSLMGAVSTHYYAVLVWIPLGLAELVRLYTRRRPDWLLWAVIVGALSPLVVYWPLLNGLRKAIGSNYWSRPSVMLVEEAYRSYLTLAFFPLLGAVIVWGILSLGSGGGPAKMRVLPPHEVVAALALTALPFFGVAMAFVAGGFSARYTLPCMIGMAIAAALLAYRATGGRPLLGCVMVAVFLGWYTFKVPGTYKRFLAGRGSGLRSAPAPFEGMAWARAAAASSLPLAAANSVFYLQLQRYAPAGLADRLYYVADTAAALQYDHYTTGEVVIQASRPFFPIRVAEYAQFVAANPRFLLCVRLTQPAWILEKLRDDGAELVLKARQGDEMLFEVAIRR